MIPQRSLHFPAGELSSNAEFWKHVKSLGFVIIGKNTNYPNNPDLFFDVELPEGWEKRPTAHDMWSEIYDANGSKRFMVFFKAAFYDLNAHITAVNRYESSTDYEDDSDFRVNYVLDHKLNKRVFESSRHDGDHYNMGHDEISNWLQDNYSDHRNPVAYWEDE